MIGRDWLSKYSGNPYLKIHRVLKVPQKNDRKIFQFLNSLHQLETFDFFPYKRNKGSCDAVSIDQNIYHIFPLLLGKHAFHLGFFWDTFQVQKYYSSELFNQIPLLTEV